MVSWITSLGGKIFWMVNTKIIIKICMMKENNYMKVLVTGAKGQLGYDVIKALKELNIAHLGIDKDELDITIEQDVFRSYKGITTLHLSFTVQPIQRLIKAEEDKELCL